MAQTLRALTLSTNLPRLVALAAFGAPVAAGLALTLAPAFGYLPALGGRELTLEPWRLLLAEPGFRGGLGLTRWVGFAATALAVTLVVAASLTIIGA